MIQVANEVVTMPHVALNWRRVELWTVFSYRVVGQVRESVVQVLGVILRKRFKKVSQLSQLAVNVLTWFGTDF